MNERIKELLKQAGFIGEGFNNTVMGTCQETALENFAELIVKECADIAKHHVMNISTYGDAEFVNEQIRKHFGVEE